MMMERRQRVLLLLTGISAAALSVSVFVYARLRKKNIFNMSNQKSEGAGKKVEMEMTLDEVHSQWLAQMVAKYNLPTTDKALRIVLSYAKQSGEEVLIFDKVRCLFCGEKKKLSEKHTIDVSHDEYLMEMVSKYKLASKDKAVRIILEYAMSCDDEANIFEVKRCVHGETCKNCL